MKSCCFLIVSCPIKAILEEPKHYNLLNAVYRAGNSKKTTQTNLYEVSTSKLLQLYNLASSRLGSQ